MKHVIQKNKILLTLVFSIFTSQALLSFSPTNFFRPYEVDYQATDWKHSNFRFGAAVEYGDTDECRDWDENKKNVLQIYNCHESSIAMLLGSPKGSRIDRLAKSLGVSSATVTANDDRGRFLVTGEYKAWDLTFFGKYKLPINLDGTFELAVYVPYRSKEFYNISWCDQTLDVLSSDKEFKDLVSSKIAAKAKELGCLDINENGLKQEGLGDISVILGWNQDFRQDKQYLKSVRINASVGVTIPTGEKRDVDQSLSLPLGNDGAWGIPASLGLDLDFVQNISAGLDLSLLGVFDKTGIYRMKTSTKQTDFLLLHKGEATRSQGVCWKFTLFAQAKKIVSGVSGMVSYHFVKHDEDRFHPKSYDFNKTIANSAQGLREWSAHSFVFRLGYDPFGARSAIKPHISLFYKLPVAGKRAILADTFGGQVGFEF